MEEITTVADYTAPDGKYSGGAKQALYRDNPIEKLHKYFDMNYWKNRWGLTYQKAELEAFEEFLKCFDDARLKEHLVVRANNEHNWNILFQRIDQLIKRRVDEGRAKEREKVRQELKKSEKEDHGKQN